MGTTTAIASVVPRRAARTAFTRWMTHGTIVLADLIALTVAGALAVLIRYAFHAQFSPSNYLSFAPSVGIFLIVFAFAGLYPGIATSPIEEFRLILRASSIGFLLLIGTTFFLREGVLFSRIVFFLAWLLSIAFVPVSRRFMRGWCSLKPWWGIPTVIVGEQAAGLMMLELLQGHHRIGLRPVALLVEENTGTLRTAKHPRGIFHGDFSHAKQMAEEYRDCYAVIAVPNAGSERIRDIVSEYADQYRRILIIPDLFGMKSLSVSARDICGVLALQVDQNLTLFFPQLLKRSFDLAVSVTLALLISPLLLLLAIGVRLSSPGPIFYGQRRIGKNRDAFKVWKFRSMVVDADEVLKSHLDRDPQLREEWERDHKLRRDPRVTWIGRFLRKSSLDELPQIWNVICGQMSLVGPTAHHHRRDRALRQDLRPVPARLSRSHRPLADQRTQRHHLRVAHLRIDDYYVRNWSLSLDVYILLRTLKTIFLSEGAY